MKIPGRWVVAARDAFNGKLLWEHPITSWTDWRRPFRSGPAQLARLLVAAAGKLFVPLGVDAPVSALSGSTGKVIRSYPQTTGVEEILVDQGLLLAVMGTPYTTQSLKRLQRRGRLPVPPTRRSEQYRRALVAVDIQTGDTRWQWRGNEGNPEPLTVALDTYRVCFQLGDGVVCLDRQTGREQWRTEGTRKGSRMPQRMAQSTLLLDRDSVLWSNGKRLTAFDARNGRERWTAPAKPGFRSPPDVFVIDGIVWTGPDFAAGRDLKANRQN